MSGKFIASLLILVCLFGSLFALAHPTAYEGQDPGAGTSVIDQPQKNPPLIVAFESGEVVLPLVDYPAEGGQMEEWGIVQDAILAAAFMVGLIVLAGISRIIGAKKKNKKQKAK